MRISHILTYPIVKRAWEDFQTRSHAAPRIPVHQTQTAISSDPYLSLKQKNKAKELLTLAGVFGGQPKAGLISTEDILRAAIGTGLGYAGGSVASSLLSGLFGLRRPARRTLQGVGALAGALRSTGIWQ